MTLDDFLCDCSAYQAATGRSRVWLSKALFNSTYKLDALAEGRADVGVRRLAAAATLLAYLTSCLIDDDQGRA